MDAIRTLQEQEQRTRRLLVALEEKQHLVGVYQGSEEALADHCQELQKQVVELHADRAEIHASLRVCPLAQPCNGSEVLFARVGNMLRCTLLYWISFFE